MRGSVRLFRVFGIGINIHITFLLLLLFVVSGGIKLFALVIGIFFFVTMHELCHSLTARRFGIETSEITLFPIGGVASMSNTPDKPMEELAISLAGPLSNMAVIALLFYPMRNFLGDAVFFHPLSISTWPLTVSYIYWINLALAVFNMIPAFPMDGGRILRSVLAVRMGKVKATRIAVRLGHFFALVFAYFGIVRGNVILIAIAIFVYLAASSEEMQVHIKETLKKFKIRDILPADFLTPDRYPDKSEAEDAVIVERTERRAMNKILIAPSILSADFSRLGEEVMAVEKAGADWVHVDVMDGHFVKNITMGPLIVRSIRPVTGLPIDVHLMIKEPERYIEDFAKAGADIITFHIESESDPKETIRLIKYFKKRAGVSIKPNTDIKDISQILPMVDMVLVMTVEPGFGGQGFIKDCLPKIEELRKVFKKDIEVDGGINEHSAKEVISMGANVIVAGTSIFSAKDYTDAVRKLRGGN